MNNNARGLAGALVGVVGGLTAGYVAGAINNPKPPVYREPETICGCKHHFSMHDESGCHQTWNEKVVKEKHDAVTETDELGYKVTKQPARSSFDVVPSRCGCKRYTGPEPLPQYV